MSTTVRRRAGASLAVTVALVMWVVSANPINLYAQPTTTNAGSLGLDPQAFRFENYASDIDELGDSKGLEAALNNLCNHTATIGDLDKIMAQAGAQILTMPGGRTYLYPPLAQGTSWPLSPDSVGAIERTSHKIRTRDLGVGADSAGNIIACTYWSGTGVDGGVFKAHMPAISPLARASKDSGASATRKVAFGDKTDNQAIMMYFYVADGNYSHVADGNARLLTTYWTFDTGGKRVLMLADERFDPSLPWTNASRFPLANNGEPDWKHIYWANMPSAYGVLDNFHAFQAGRGKPIIDPVTGDSTSVTDVPYDPNGPNGNSVVSTIQHSR